MDPALAPRPPITMPWAVPPAAQPTHQLFSALPLPMMVVLTDRRVIVANAAALRLAHEGMSCLREDHLVSVGQLDIPRLGELLNRACRGCASRTGLWFTPSLATGSIHLAPVAASVLHASHWPVGSLLLTVQLDEPALTQAARIDALSRQFHLSRAERDVLLLLADGEPVEATSRHLGIRVSTIRSHIRNLLGKTQATTLMQLLRWTGSSSLLPH